MQIKEQVNKMLKFKKTHDTIRVTKENYDLIKKITSKSAPVFHELYYVHANKYFTCIEIFDFMEFSKRNFLNDFINDESIVVSIDVSHVKEQTFDNTVDSILDNSSGETLGKQTVRKHKNSQDIIDSVNDFDNYITATHDSVKKITVRLYIFAKSKQTLQDKVDSVTVMLSRKKMRGYIQTNDLITDVQSLTKVNETVGQLVSSTTVAHALMRSEVNVIDENVPLLGYTTNGLYAPDIFDFGNNSYNIITLSGMGGGKSAMFKSLLEGYDLCSNFTLQILDWHHEYTDFCDLLGIPVVSIREGNNINLMQIFHVENNNGMISKNDTTARISVIVEVFKNTTSLTNETVILQLEKNLTSMYKKYIGKKISDLKNEDWFLLAELKKFIVDKQNSNEYEEEAKQDIYALLLGLDKLVDTYGHLYNVYTNMDFDLKKSICFDISFLQTNKDKNIVGAYVMLLMSYISQALRYNLEKNNIMMKEKGVKPYQLKRPLHPYFLLVDETMEYATSSFLTYTLSLMKFMRKAYSGAGFVIHATSDTKRQMVDDDGKANNLLSQLFELCTNKFIGRTDGESLEDLPKLIKGITVQDTKIISKFKKGKNGERSFFVFDDKKRKIIFKSIITDFQKNYYGGGV